MEWARANTIEQINAGPFLVQTLGRVTLKPNRADQHSNTKPVRYTIKSDDFVWTHAVAIADQPFRHRLWSNHESRYLDNDFVRSEFFWGDSLGTALEIPPKWFPLGGEIVFHMEDTSGRGGDVHLELLGFKASSCGTPKELTCVDPGCQCDRARFGPHRGLFVLSTPSLTGIPTPPGEPQEATITNEGMNHFRVVYLHALARNQDGVENSARSWRGNLATKDPRECERQTLSNANMIGAAWTGTVARPGRPPSPMVIEEGSDVDVTTEDLLGQGVNEIHMSLIGERLDQELLRANA